jgi:DUSP domain
VFDFFIDGSKSALKPHMLENLDFILIPEEAWENLVKWYQMADGQVYSLAINLFLDLFIASMKGDDEYMFSLSLTLFCISQ